MGRADDNRWTTVFGQCCQLVDGGCHLIHEITSQNQIVTRVASQIHLRRHDHHGTILCRLSAGGDQPVQIAPDIAKMWVQLRKRDGKGWVHMSTIYFRIKNSRPAFTMDRPS